MTYNYSWCTCMCTPSRREGFGMVFIEALACEALVITSNIAPLNEYMKNEENGLLVDDFENPQSLAQQIIKGCTDIVLRTRIKANARLSVNIFDKDKIKKQEMSIYQQVLDGQSRGKILNNTSQASLDGKINASYQKALGWVRQNTLSQGGIIVNTLERVPYLEVTGYFIPTLIKAKELDLARSYADLIARTQEEDGSFLGPDRKKYVFDSGQALRGMVAASVLWPKFKSPAVRTADYILSQMESNGRIRISYEYAIPEHIPVYILPALHEAGLALERPEYIQAAQKSIAYYKQQPDVLNAKVLTHFLAYILDGFIDMGETDFVRPFIEKLFLTQGKDGRIGAYAGVHWICSVGLIQLAIVAYKLGMEKQGDGALQYACSIQNPTGGFYGSYGWWASYFPKAEISWANKFFLDAVHLRKEKYR